MQILCLFFFFLPESNQKLLSESLKKELWVNFISQRDHQDKEEKSDFQNYKTKRLKENEKEGFQQKGGTLQAL